MSLDQTYGDDGDSDGYDFLVRSALDTEALAAQHERAVDVRAALADLPERDRDIILRRLDGDETLEEVGHRYGLSKERIRQLETRATERLGRAMARGKRATLAT